MSIFATATAVATWPLPLAGVSDVIEVVHPAWKGWGGDRIQLGPAQRIPPSSHDKELANKMPSFSQPTAVHQCHQDLGS